MNKLQVVHHTIVGFYKRPQPLLKNKTRVPDMQPVHRVQKRLVVSNHTNRRGRPPKCTESWKKKLILLRMCGLDASQVVAVLTMQGDGAAETK